VGVRSRNRTSEWDIVKSRYNPVQGRRIAWRLAMYGLSLTCEEKDFYSYSYRRHPSTPALLDTGSQLLSYP